MTIVKACLIKDVIKNTGTECNTSMGPLGMLIAVPRSFTFTDSDLLDPVTWMRTAIHADKEFRVYPLFGNEAPIKNLKVSDPSDQIQTLDDGSQVLVRYGFYNETCETTQGGLCFAQSLMTLNRSGYRILRLDKFGKMHARIEPDGTSYSGVVTDFMYAAAPALADMKNTVYLNKFVLSTSPEELVGNGIIFANANQLLNLMGLIDVKFVAGTTANTTTHLYAKVITKCAESDLVARFGVKWDHANNFILKDASGAPVTVTVSHSGSEISFAGTFTTGNKYYLTGAKPSVWLGNGIAGYDGEDFTLEITA